MIFYQQIKLTLFFKYQNSIDIHLCQNHFLLYWQQFMYKGKAFFKRNKLYGMFEGNN
jgi:hypothetical protein